MGVVNRCAETFFAGAVLGLVLPGLVPAPPAVGAVLHAPAGEWDTSALAPTGAASAWAWLSAYYDGAFPATYPEAIVRTTNGGRSWLDRTPPGFSQGTAQRSVEGLDAVSATDAWVTYGPLGSGSWRALIATTEGGRYWHRLGRLPSPYCSLQMLDATVGWCVASVGAMGSEPVAIYRTIDGGRRWALESRSPSSPPSWGPGTPGALPFGCDKLVGFSTATVGSAAFACAAGLSPIYISTDAGRTWRAQRVEPLPASYGLAPGNAAAWSSAPVLDGKLGAVGLSVEGRHDTSLVYRTTDAGSTWWPVVPPGPPRAWSVDVVTATAWKLTAGTAVLTTTDAGRKWATAKSALDFAFQGGTLDYANAKDGWRVPVKGHPLHRTSDGGKTWQTVALPAFPG
jgi:photosystem II stability/assembly factor-like uncharacterized protein